MRTSLSIILICFSFIASIEAQDRFDSMLSVWSDPKQADTARFDAYYDLIRYKYLFSNPDTVGEMSEPLNVFVAQGQLDRSSRLMRLRAKAVRLMGDFAGSNKIHIDFQERHGDSLSASERFFNLIEMGHNFYHLGDFSRALSHYELAMSLIQEKTHPERFELPYLGLGLVHRELKDYQKALEYQFLAYDMYSEGTYDKGRKKKIGVIAALNNLGNIYYDMGRYDTALVYHRRSLKLKREVGDIIRIGRSLSSIGDVYVRSNMLDSALIYYEEGLEMQTAAKNRENIADLLIAIGMLQHKRGRYKEALDHCRQSMEVAVDIQSLLRQKQACECLVKVHQGLGNGKLALEYFEQMESLEDSLRSSEALQMARLSEFRLQQTADSIQKAEEDYQRELAHRELIREQNQIRNIAIASSIFLFFIALGVYGRWRFVHRSRAELQREQERSESLLLNILPSEIADELKVKGRAEARTFDEVTILFTDFKEFNKQADQMSARELVAEVNVFFQAFDEICERYQVEKIKTIGDAYMAAGGLPVPNEQAVMSTVQAGLDMRDFVQRHNQALLAAGKPTFELRVGIHTGPVVAGIVGVKKFQFDIWGDTVNTAARVESAGEMGRVNISHATYQVLKENPSLQFESRGSVEVKGKGKIEMYFVDRWPEAS